MNGFWNWTSNAISNVASAIKQTASLIAATPATIKTIYDYIRDPAKNFTLQTVKGFLAFWQPGAVITVIESKKIRPVVVKALSANFIYMALAILFEMTRKELPQLVPAVENTAIEWGASSLIFAIDAFALLYMLRKYSASYVDNTCDNSAISKVIYDEIPSTNNHGNKCEHGYMSQFQAGCASTFYYLGKMFAVWNVENAAYRYVPALGIAAVWPLKAFAYGETLVEYKLSSLGNCTNCRYEKLSVNNGYSFGMGLALYGTYQVISFAFNRYLGLQNSFFTDAVFNVLFQYSIISALINDKPLPEQVKVELVLPPVKAGDEPRVFKTRGWEVFFPMRIAVEAWMNVGGAKIIDAYNNPDPRTDIGEQIKQVMNCPPVVLARKAMIDTNIQSENIVTRESFLRPYNMYVKQTQDFVNWLTDMRKDWLKNKLPVVADYIPESILMRYTNGYNKDQINLAFDARLEQLLILTNNFIKFVNSKNGQQFLKQYKNNLLNQVLQEQAASATPPAIEQQPRPQAEEVRPPVRTVDPERYLPQEPVPPPAAPPVAVPKEEVPRPQRRVRVDRFLDGAQRVERLDETPAPSASLPGNVRLSSSGMFRRSNPSASNTAAPLSASRQGQKPNV